MLTSGFSGATGESLEQQVHLAIFKTIRHIAEEGPCVNTGRSADHALAENPNLLSLFISAPLEDRIARVAKRQKVTPEEAKSLIQKTDKRRASYCEYYASKKWGAVDAYDFCLNSSALGLGGTVELIQAMVAHKEHPIPSPTRSTPPVTEAWRFSERPQGPFSVSKNLSPRRRQLVSVRFAPENRGLRNRLVLAPAALRLFPSMGSCAHPSPAAGVASVKAARPLTAASTLPSRRIYFIDSLNGPKGAVLLRVCGKKQFDKYTCLHGFRLMFIYRKTAYLYSAGA